MSDNKKNLSSTKDLKRVLGFWDLMAVGIGSIIGSGIMSLTGWGIDETGRSVCIAFVIGGIIAVLARSPQIFLNSVARFRGGDYSMVGTFLGPRWTGTYSMIALLTSVTLCMYALSFADYAMPFLPNVSRKVIALSILTFLFITNTFGINAFSKIQNAAVVILVISLTAFTAVGLTKLDGNYFEPTQFMTHGAVGLWQASVLMSYTCDGAQYVTQMSGEAKNPTRDIPRVMLFSTLGVSLFYGLIGVVAVYAPSAFALTHSRQASRDRNRMMRSFFFIASSLSDPARRQRGLSARRAGVRYSSGRRMISMSCCGLPPSMKKSFSSQPSYCAGTRQVMTPPDAVALTIPTKRPFL